MIIGILLDELETISFDKDTTIEFAKEGLKRGNQVWFFFPSSLILLNSEVFAIAIPYSKELGNHNAHRFWSTAAKRIKLGDLDVILIRHDPPYDERYLTCCYILERLKGQVLMINDPTSLRSCPEKLFVTKFPEIHPPTLITRNRNEILEFREKYQEIVIKPLFQFRGMDVFYIKHNDSNFYSILDTLERCHEEPLVFQKYLPDVKMGDKRIFLIDGKPVAALNRLPKKDDSRSNMFVGGSPEKSNITDSDQAICNIVGPELSKLGLYFVGIDVIGDFVTEINATSPTGALQLREVSGIDLASIFWDFIYLKHKAEYDL